MRRCGSSKTKAILPAALLAALALLPQSCKDKQPAPRQADGEGGKYDLAAGDETKGGRTIAPRYAEAQTAMGREDWQTAARLLGALTAEKPGHSPYWNDLGVCYLRAGDAKKADDAFSRALAADPLYFKARFNQGVMLAEAGDDKGAEKAYLDALRLNGNYGEALYNLGLLQQRQGRWDEAEKSYQKALGTSRSARLYKAQYNLGVIAARRGDFLAAIQRYKQTILMNQSFFPAYLNLGIACARLERYSDAVDATRRACELMPGDGKAVAYLSRYLDKAGRAEESAAVCEKAFQAGVKHPELFARAAQIAAEKKDDRLAIQYYQEAIRLNPDSKTYFNLGLAFRRQNNLVEAAKAYEAAVRLDPQYAKAWLNLGYVYMKLKRFDESRRCFGKSLAIQPGYSNALNGLKDLAAAQGATNE